MWTVWMRTNRMYFIWMRTNRMCTNWMRTNRMYTHCLIAICVLIERAILECALIECVLFECALIGCELFECTLIGCELFECQLQFGLKKNRVTLVNLFRMWMGWNRTQFLNQYKFYCFIISMQLLLQMSTLLLLWQMSLNRDFFFVTTFRHPWMLASMAGWHLYLVPELHVN